MPNESYRQSPEAVVKKLETDLAKGLSSEEAAKRLEQYGANELEEKKRQSFMTRLINQFKDTMVLILIAACAVSAILNELLDAAVILAIVIINAILGLIQEGRAEKAIEALQKMTSPQARVLRDGQQNLVDASRLVPGDVVLIEAGDIIPADLRLIETAVMRIDEASLTGESVPVEKDASLTLDGEIQLGDRANMAYMSTPVTNGRGRGIVVATSGHTIIGSIANQLQDIEEHETPLQRNLNQLGKWLGIVCVGVCAVVLVQGVLLGGTFLDMFLTAVSLAVAAIPEGLPAVVTIVLALGMKRMADRHAIVKKLLAVETLGSVDVICSDKTGTLTQNEMMVTRLYLPGRLIEVGGHGYKPEGELADSTDGKPVQDAKAGRLGMLLKIGALCNDANLVEEEGVYSILGDPTEGAMVTVAAKAGLDQSELAKQYERTDDLPFDSERKMMSTFHAGFNQAKKVSLTKGAPDIILSRCTSWLTDDGPEHLSDALRNEILETNHQLASSALRVLAFACKFHDDAVEAAEEELVFVGLMGMIDPARPEARDAVTLCTHAGIRAVMITGDYRDTAVAIAQDLGLMKPGDEVLTGTELDDLSDEDLLIAVEKTAVYARVSPDHKVRIVSALRQNGHIASMTGDGVNDAMALKTADIGVAMGITGTDVAKGTADMILTDDNFATIVAAVKEGRVLYSNIRKFVGFLLSCNVGEILVIFLTTLIMGPAFVPLLPIQLLWLNLLTDSFPALALGQEKGEPDVMDRKPRNQKEPILNKLMIRTISIQSLAIFAATFSAFQLGLIYYPQAVGASDGARTYAFITLIMAELFRSFSARSERSPVIKLGIFRNATLNKAILLCFVLMLAVIYVPFLDPIFGTIELSLMDWARILPLSLIPFAAAEIDKFIQLIRRNKVQG